MDKRVYDGCLSDDLYEFVENIKAKYEVLKRKFPEAHVTYFPVENKWMVHEWGNPLSGMHTDKLSAIMEAIQKEN